MFGDDYGWEGVRNDFWRFVETNGFGHNPDNLFTYKLVRSIPDIPTSMIFWVIQKAKY